MTTQESLDEKDILILRTLQQNAKLTTKQVAAECHLSLTPV
ncbi:MAG: AsnC family protein, partial [Bacteroidaceae bacterium]|nr:AsnC family protein [Bacteroidaceae bacterium]